MQVNIRYIKALRAYHGLSQTDMAEILNCTFNTYNRKENGKSKFTLDDLNLLSKLFNVPISNFFKDEVAI